MCGFSQFSGLDENARVPGAMVKPLFACERPRFELERSAWPHSFSRVLRVPGGWRPISAHASTRRRLRASVWVIPLGLNFSPQQHLLQLSFVAQRDRWAEAILRPRDAPWRARWRSPAAGNLPRVCLRGCDVSPPERIPQPAWTGIGLGQHLLRLVPLFLVPACVNLLCSISNRSQHAFHPKFSVAHGHRMLKLINLRAAVPGIPLSSAGLSVKPARARRPTFA